MIRLIQLLLMTCTLVLGAMPAYANATDSTTIKVSVVHDGRDNTRMRSTGSALSGGRTNISAADIKQKHAISLGTLSINSVANYDVAFKSANGYRLKNANGTLAEYKIKYDGKNIILNSNILNSTRLNLKKSKTGVYEDTLTVIVTAP